MRYGIDGRCIQDHFPGIGRYAYALAQHVPALAPNDEFVVYHDPTANNTRYELAALARSGNVRLERVEVGPLSLRQQAVLPRLARRDRLDLYHSPYYAISYLMPCPVVVTIHDLIPRLHPDCLPNPRLSAVFSLMLRAALWRAAGILVDAESTRADLAETMRVALSRITTVPLAAGAEFSPRATRKVAQLLQRLQLDTPYLLYVGSNKPHKNLPRLVEAWSSLTDPERSGRCLILAGREDPRYPQARKLVARLGISGSVRFLGDVREQDLPLLYGGALAFVFPSVYEGFGLPVLEAMACGIPVGCANTSSMPDIVGDAALTFEPQSVTSIAEALRRLMAEPDLRESLAEAGLARSRVFSWERTATETLAVYRRIVSG